MPKFRIPYKKIVYGYFYGEAKDINEASEIYSNWDEIENKSDYEISDVERDD